jgi:hypothetical protein
MILPASGLRGSFGYSLALCTLHWATGSKNGAARTTIVTRVTMALSYCHKGSTRPGRPTISICLPGERHLALACPSRPPPIPIISGVVRGGRQAVVVTGGRAMDWDSSC